MVEFQYFAGCPHAAETWRHLEELTAEGFLLPDEVQVTEVRDAEEARRMQFAGSPTVLVDGVDIYTEEKPRETNFACRVYVVNGMRTGVLPKEFIRQQISKLRGGTSHRGKSGS
ncbi:MAG: alkylmercury lyase [Calditrichaeota bacterium]|nr:alkylmercury lyase [Calditrichota bacterium]